MTNDAGLFGASNLPARRPWASVRNRVENGCLYYDYPGRGPSGGVAVSSSGSVTRLVDPTGALDAFIRITNGQGVLAFASKYGPLLLCGHGEPYRHAPGCWPKAGWNRPDGGESISDWLTWVGTARVIIQAAIALHAGGPLPSFLEDGYLQYRDLRASAAETLRAPAESFTLGKPEWARLEISIQVNRWLRLGGVEPELDWTTETPRFQLAAETFGVLGLQLVTSVSRAHGLTTCAVCGMPYTARRKPRAGERNYCEASQGEGNKLRVQAYKARRRKEEGENHDQ